MTHPTFHLWLGADLLGRARSEGVPVLDANELLRAANVARGLGRDVLANALMDELRAASAPRTFRCSEQEDGQTATLAEMLEANDEDEDVIAWLRGARVGDRFDAGFCHGTWVERVS